MKIQHIWIYPVKSLGGIEKASWQATVSGFLYDRTWMLVDENFHFITQREIAELSLFSVDVDKAAVYISRNEESINWETDAYEKKEFITKVWDDDAIVHKIPGMAHQFFSDLLQRKVYIVRQSHKNARQHFAKTIDKNIPVSLADGYPYLALGSKSVENLNQMLPSPITYHRFRPNLVIETLSPHEEDGWKKISSEEVEFINIKPCARCQIINIDQSTAEQSKDPLKTLASYRKVDNKVLFGTNMICSREGSIHQGGTLHIKE